MGEYIHLLDEEDHHLDDEIESVRDDMNYTGKGKLFTCWSDLFLTKIDPFKKFNQMAQFCVICVENHC